MLRKMIFAAVAVGVAVGIPASGAFAAASHSDPTGMVLDIGSSPTGVPANCPFANGDAAFTISSGNAVIHDSTNKNGDWGGSTITGQAVFSEDGTPLYSGHLTTWQGGGGNIQGQNEGGETLTFHGTGAAGSLDLHVNFHGTVSASGNMVGNVVNVNVTCS